MNAGSCGSGLIRSAPAFDPNGLAILGGKSQVQIYANRDGDDPVPTVELEGNEARINGALLLPGSVLVAQAATRNAFNHLMDFEDMGGGLEQYDSGWVSLLTFETENDERTTIVDISAMVGLITLQMSATPQSGFIQWNIQINTRMLKDDTTVWPPGSADFLPLARLSASGNVNTVLSYVRPYSFIDFAPEEGEATYEWQLQIIILNSAGTSPTGNWTLDSCHGRMLVPKNEL